MAPGLVKFAAVVGIGLAVGLPLRAEAATYHYSSDMGFASFTNQTEYGTLTVEEGCQFAGDFFPESNADNLAMGAEEISYDSDTCRSEYRVGRLTEAPRDWPPPPDSDGTIDDSGETWVPGLQEPEPPAVCAPFDPCPLRRASPAKAQVTAASSRRWFPRKVLQSSIAWEDPFQKDVNKTEVRLNYRSTDDCAAAGRVSHWWRHSWLSETGWERTHEEHTYQAFCTFAATETKARFVNDLFCDIIGSPQEDPPPTRTRHWPNRAIGLPAGRHKPFREYSKAGGCSFLLHVELKWTIRRLYA
jgi:hypothetical protein